MVGYPQDLSSAGATYIFEAEYDGLTSSWEKWSQNSEGILDIREVGDKFGDVLAVGDFDGNGTDDLAVGVPGEDANNPYVGSLVMDTGCVNVIYGSFSIYDGGWGSGGGSGTGGE